MKVGIMTMHRIPNYGSIMQALSLKRMIEALGHQVCFVDYQIQPDIMHKGDLKEKIICWSKSQKYSLCGTELGKHPVWGQGISMLGVSTRYEYRKKVDVLVIGSDEVFNCLQPGYNVGYSQELFGKHNRAKKVITYAASFGNATLSGLKRYHVDGEVGTLISQMAAISVRDENSDKIVQEICGECPYLHWDPVLLGGLEQENWPIPELHNYVVIYGYHKRFTEQECRQIMDFAHQRGKIVIALGEDQVLRDQHIHCMPDEVFGYFAQADCVFTDTFHGTIFSVVMHRPFLTVIRPGKNGNSQKLNSLAKMLSITERVVDSFACANQYMDTPVDFDAIDSLRAVERKKAMNYLKQNLQLGSNV